MKFYVNSFYGDRLGGEKVGLPNIYPNFYIGLFTQSKTIGEGNFCGYYGAEYYLDTELLAYYQAEGPIYQPEKRISSVYGCYFKRKKMLIGSHMWTRVIEAETVEEAYKKFENAEWRPWDYYKDEVKRRGKMAAKEKKAPDRLLAKGFKEEEEMKYIAAEYCDNDVIARQILADLAGGSVNDTINSLATKITFGNNRKPQSEFNYRNLAEPVFELDNDIDMTKLIIKNSIDQLNYRYPKEYLTIKDVVFNPPATIVFWEDGSKTVVKAHEDEYDPEKGLAMAISKKVLGNKYEYYNTFKHWLKKYGRESI